MRNFIIIIISFLKIAILNAQEPPVQDYEKAVDYVTCICMNEVLKNGNFDCGNRPVKRTDLPGGEKRTLALFDELQSLKKGDPKSPKEFLSEEIFKNDEYPEISNFAKRRPNDIDGIKSQIANYFSDISESDQAALEGQKTGGSIGKISEGVEVADARTRNDQPSFFQSGLFSIIISSVLFLLILSSFYNRYRLRRQLKEINARIDRRATANTPLKVSQSSTPDLNRDYENMIRALGRKLEELEGRFLKMQNGPQNERSPVINPETSSMPEVVSEVFYMAVPNEDGSFDVSGKTSKESALYEFIVEPGNTSLAKFSFIAKDTKTVQSVVDYSQSYINPVCDPQNALNQNAKQIITVSSGMAEKSNGRWIVTRKAQIRYE